VPELFHAIALTQPDQFLLFEPARNGDPVSFGDGFLADAPARLRNPFLEVRYEELVDDLEGTSRKALGFLEVPWDERVLRFDEHARSKSLRSPSYAEVTKPISKRAIGRWQNYRRHLEPYLERLEPIMKALGYA